MSKHAFVSLGGSAYCAEFSDGAACRQTAGHLIHQAPATPPEPKPAEHDPHGLPAAAGIGTPAEARTGISDRNAAALADVDALRHTLLFDPDFYAPDFQARLDHIEQALRHD